MAECSCRSEGAVFLEVFPTLRAGLVRAITCFSPDARARARARTRAHTHTHTQTSSTAALTWLCILSPTGRLPSAFSKHVIADQFLPCVVCVSE